MNPIDAILCLVIFLPLTAILLGRLRIETGILALAVGFSVASLVTQIWDEYVGRLSSDEIQLVLIGCFLVTFVFVIMKDNIARHDRSSIFAIVAVGVPAAISASAMIFGRVMAHNQISGSVTTLSFLATKEDSAKWLNIASQISSGKLVSVSAVGGVLTCFLVVIFSFVRLIGPVFSFSSIDVRQAIDTVAIAQIALVPLSSFALIGFLGSDRSRRPQLLDLFRFWPAVLVMQGLVVWPMALSHISLQLAIVMLVFGLSIIGSRELSPTIFCSYSFVAAVGLSTWLGTQVVIPIFSLCCLLIFSRGLAKQLRIRVKCLNYFVLLLPVVLSLSSFRYAFDSNSRLTSLFTASGATVVSSTEMQLSVAVLLLGLLLHEKVNQITFQKYWQLIFLMTVLLVAQTQDQMRTGVLNYGSQKFGFLIFSVLLVLLIPIVFENMIGIFDRNLTALILVVLSLFTILNVNGLVTGSVIVYKDTLWPQKYIENETSWLTFGSGIRIEGDSAQMPIGCVIKLKDQSPSVSRLTYICTRLLVGVAGLENEATAVVQWQMSGDWKIARELLSNLPIGIRQRKMIVLDENNSTRDLVAIETIINSS